MISLKLIITSAILLTQIGHAADIAEKKIFTMEKSYNPENILVIGTQTDENCKFVTKNEEYLDFYWLMNGQTRKEIHSLIRSQIQGRVHFVGINKTLDLFNVKMNDLNELKNDLDDVNLEISSAVVNGECQVKSVIKLGPSANYRKLNLKRTYCEVSKNFLGIPNGCKFLDLQGVDNDTDEKLSVRFNQK